MADDVYHGRQATVQVGSAVTVPALDDTDDTDDTIDTILENETNYTGTSYTGEVMDITVTDPEASIDLENTFGGQFMVQTPSDLVEIEVTMKFSDQEVFEEMHGSPTNVDGTWSRVSGAQAPGSRKEKSFLFELSRPNGTGGSDKVRYFANNAYFQSFGEVSLDADGFAEVTGVLVCKVEDRHIETNF